MGGWLKINGHRAPGWLSHHLLHNKRGSDKHRNNLCLHDNVNHSLHLLSFIQTKVVEMNNSCLNIGDLES